MLICHSHISFYRCWVSSLPAEFEWKLRTVRSCECIVIYSDFCFAVNFITFLLLTWFTSAFNTHRHKFSYVLFIVTSCNSIVCSFQERCTFTLSPWCNTTFGLSILRTFTLEWPCLICYDKLLLNNSIITNSMPFIEEIHVGKKHKKEHSKIRHPCQE